MKTLATTALLATLCFALDAGAADRRESRPVGGEFSAIGVSAPVTVHVTQGSAASVELQGDEAALADIETVVEGSSLKIRLRKDVQRWNHKVVARVTAPRIDALAIAGSGDIHAPSITGESLKVSISGSGDVKVGGKVSGFTANISGSGDVRADALEAQRVSVSIAGSGDATVRARDTLNVSVAGSGDVRYFGDPAITKSVLGSGKVRRAGAATS